MPVAYPTGNSRAGGWEDSLAGQIAKSSVYKKYFYSRDDVLQEAKTISRATRIPQNAILSSADNLDKARKVYERQQKLGIDDIDKLFREYPELDKLARMDDNAAAIALHNMENVKETRGVIESMKLGWELDELSNERGRLGYMGMNGGAYSEEQAKRIESIEKQLAEAKHLPGLFDDPLGAIAGGTVQAAKLMARGLIGGQKMGVYGAGFGALLGAVGGGSATLGTGTVPAAIAGAKVGYSIGTRIGMAQDMYEMVAGNNYLDFKQYKNKQGGQLLTDDQARAYAAVSAAVETGIEYSNADRILGIVKGSGAEQTIKDIIEQAKNNSEFRTMLAGYVTRGLKNIGSLTAEESAEEGVQEVGNRLISNVMAANNPDGNIPSYTSAEIIGGAIEATWQAVPGSLGIGLGVQSAGGISGARRIAAALRLQGEQQAGESKLAAGIGMLRRLGENIEKNILFKKNKEVYGQVLEQQLDGTGFDKVYVDTEMVLKQDGGYELLKNVADAAGIEEEKLQETIDNGGELEVATATYAQTVLPTELGQKLENYISFDEAADCFARNRYYAGRVKKEMDAILDFESRRQKEAIENFVDTSKTITRPEERQAAKMVISNYPDNPTDGVKHLKEKMQATMDSMIEPIVEQMRSGMGKGVSIIQYDAGDASGRGMRVSENDIWYQNYFKEHGRVPSNRELREIAYDVFTGNNEYGVAGWDNSEGMDRVYEDNKAELQGIRDAMAILDRIEPELAKIEPGQLTVTEGLSKEGYQVYLDTLGKLQQAQNKEVRLAARAGAVLLARAADRFAEYMREFGSKNYTALDYAKKYSLFVDEKAGVGGGYGQSAAMRTENKKCIAKADGNINFGYIPEGIPNLLPGPIRLQVGYQVGEKDAGSGYVHILKRHGAFLSAKGYISPKDNIEKIITDILNEYDFIVAKPSRDGRQRLIFNKETPGHTGISMIMDAVNDEDGIYYSIVTIKPLSKKQAEKEKQKALSFRGERSPQGQFPVAGASGAPVGFFTGTAGGLVASNDSAFGTLSIADAQKYVNDYYYEGESYNQLMGETGASNLDAVDKNNFYNVDITGNEFGRYKDLNELRKKATTWYTANLQGTSVYNPALGEIRLEKGIGRSDVRFSRKGKSKMAHTSANEKKLLLVPSLKELIEKSNFITEAAPTKDKHKDEYFYYLHCSVGSGNNREYVIVTVVQDQGNNLSYYNHNVLTAAEYKKIEDTYIGAHGTEYSRSGQNPQEVPSFTNSITGKAKVYKQQSVVYNQTAYHGSPHKFDRFDLGAIGTGEGAQAHGWGLYFAADKKIAEGYKEKLSKEKRKAAKLNIKGQIYSYDEDIQEIVKRSDSAAIPEVVSGAESKMVDALMTVKGDLGKAVEFATQKADDEILDRLGQKDAPRNTDWEDALSELKKLKEENLQYDNGSNLYEVDVPENDVLLDEDLPLNKQPDVVRKAIYEYYKSRPDNYIVPKDENDLGDQTGEKFYKDVVFTMRVEGAENPQKLLPNC